MHLVDEFFEVGFCGAFGEGFVPIFEVDAVWVEEHFFAIGESDKVEFELLIE